MKVIENITLYQCDHCKRDYKRKHFAIAHEPKCKKNPDNYQICLDGCPELEKKKVEIHFDAYDGDHYEDRELLFCLAKKEFVYPFWVDGYLSEDIKDEIPNNPMPKECDECSCFKFL